MFSALRLHFSALLFLKGKLYRVLDNQLKWQSMFNKFSETPHRPTYAWRPCTGPSAGGRLLFFFPSPARGSPSRKQRPSPPPSSATKPALGSQGRHDINPTLEARRRSRPLRPHKASRVLSPVVAKEPNEGASPLCADAEGQHGTLAAHKGLKGKNRSRASAGRERRQR